MPGSYYCPDQLKVSSGFEKDSENREKLWLHNIDVTENNTQNDCIKKKIRNEMAIDYFLMSSIRNLKHVSQFAYSSCSPC